MSQISMSLIRIAGDEGIKPDIRIEAVRSLAAYLNEGNVKTTLEMLAADNRVNKMIRLEAVKALGGRR